MFGLDDAIAGWSSGDAVLLVVVVGVLLGLRHATDPDHLAAMSALIATDRSAGARRAGVLGLAWGLGHAATLFAFGLPIVLAAAYLPDPVQRGAEAAVGVVIIVLAVRLLLRHEPALGRSPLEAFGIGLVHGIGGSAGVGVLLLAGIADHRLALGALLLFAGCTALSMGVVSLGFGYLLTRGAVMKRLLVPAPAMGVASLAFGLWYVLGAFDFVTYGL